MHTSSIAARSQKYCSTCRKGRTRQVGLYVVVLAFGSGSAMVEAFINLSSLLLCTLCRRRFHKSIYSRITHPPQAALKSRWCSVRADSNLFAGFCAGGVARRSNLASFTGFAHTLRAPSMPDAGHNTQRRRRSQDLISVPDGVPSDLSDQVKHND